MLPRCGIIFCVLSLVINTALGLQCMRCLDLVYSSNMQLVHSLLQGRQNEVCRQREDVDGFQMITCQQPGMGRAVKCGFLAGQTHGFLLDVMSVALSLTIHARDCIQVNVTNTVPEMDGCRMGQTQDSFYVNQVMKWTNRFVFDNYMGETCFCSEDECTAGAAHLFSFRKTGIVIILSGLIYSLITVS